LKTAESFMVSRLLKHAICGKLSRNMCEWRFANLPKVKARTLDALFAAMGVALDLDMVTPEDIIGWIAHCGYPLP